jgi:hypothetical protein
VIGLFEVSGAQTPYTYPIFFILVFIWVGVSMPPRTALLLMPLTVVAYVLPLLRVGTNPMAFEFGSNPVRCAITFRIDAYPRPKHVWLSHCGDMKRTCG